MADHGSSQLELTPLHRAALIAAIDRIIPEDDFPSASQAGGERFILQLLAGDAAEYAALILDGLDALNRLAGGSFVDLEIARQDTILTHLDEAHQTFFNKLVELVQEGYYADPENGGNRRAVSWKMVGYDPRVPGYVPWDIE